MPPLFPRRPCSFVILSDHCEGEGVADLAVRGERVLPQAAFEREPQALGDTGTARVARVAVDRNPACTEAVEGTGGDESHRFADVAMPLRIRTDPIREI